MGAKNYGEIRFGEEGLAVFYHGDKNGGVRVIIISYSVNM